MIFKFRSNSESDILNSRFYQLPNENNDAADRPCLDGQYSKTVKETVSNSNKRMIKLVASSSIYDDDDSEQDDLVEEEEEEEKFFENISKGLYIWFFSFLNKF